MLEQTTVTVGDDLMTIESLPATPALQLLTRTVRIVGGVGKGIKDFPSSQAEFKALSSKLEEHLHLGNMLDGLIERLDSKELPEMLKGIVRDSLPRFRDAPKKGEGSFDDWYEDRFSRNLPELFALLFEIYKHNYGEPFEWLADFFRATHSKGVPDPGSPRQS